MSKSLEWYELQTGWSEDHNYQTPSVTSSALQNWYQEMKNIFPPMNGVDVPTDEQLEENEELYSYI